ncbi:MAG: hypothetical protein R3D83_10485 [Caenibius sp.]
MPRKTRVSMIDHARQEADAIVAKAEADSKVMIERRKKMAGQDRRGGTRGGGREWR